MKAFFAPRTPLVLQTEAAECGLACMAMVAARHGLEHDLVTWRARYGVGLQGVDLDTLFGIAEDVGFEAEALRLEIEDLSDLALPAILHWDMVHFVVLESVDIGGVWILDPASGRRRLTFDKLSRHFTGVVLELRPGQAFVRQTTKSDVKAAELVGRLDGLGRVLAASAALAAVYQVYGLTIPITIQLAVDYAVGTGEGSLLLLLGAGFCAVALFGLSADWLRTRILTRLNAVVDHRICDGLVAKLLRLPLAWFEQRHAGDILSRLTSTEAIRKVIAEFGVSVAVDGALSLAALVLAAIYSPLAAVLIALSALLVAGVRVGVHRARREQEEDLIRAEAEEQTNLLESVRAAQTIKVFGAEERRHGLWRRKNRRTLALRSRLEHLRANERLATNLIQAVEQVALLLVCAQAAIDGALSLGALFAVLACRRQFADAATKLLDAAVQWRLLELHFDRVSDIVRSEPEPQDTLSDKVRFIRAGKIEVRDLTFTYGDPTQPIFEGLNLVVEGGSFTAIAGRSGCGKTTLLKVIIGLLEPTAGEILFDGRKLDRSEHRALRKEIAVVMQDDHLLAGTIAQNVSFFSDQIDLAHLKACCKAAAIHDEIEAMPMGYSTIVTDLGSSLSGGQRQRIMLARALYRRPSILVMDEGTSHLDLDAERRINEALSKLSITRLVVAHRPDTLAAADRVISISKSNAVWARGPG